MILKITNNKKSIILINCYRPPDNDISIIKINSSIQLIDSRYKNTAIIIFGDLNFKRDIVENKFNLI